VTRHETVAVAAGPGQEARNVKVLLVSAWGAGRAYDELVRCAGLDRFAVHTLTESPEEADVILFTETVHFDDPEWRTLRQHPYLQRFREKCFIYNESDEPWCVLPGLYCSMPRRSFQPRRQKAFNYLYTMNDKVTGRAASERRWLYSFMGAANANARRRILKLVDARAVLEDTSQFNIWLATTEEERERRQRRYVEVMQGSRFVLCPRGAGTSSYRLFEAMKMGLAPVLVSDEWVEPEGPDWGAFMLRAREDEVAKIPELLREHEGEAVDRGVRARMAYEAFFSAEVQFHRAVEACRELLSLRVLPESVTRFRPSLEHARSSVHRWLHEGKVFVQQRLKT
jgi:hypothetical protein